MQAHPDAKEGREYLLRGRDVDINDLTDYGPALDIAPGYFLGHHDHSQKQMNQEYIGELSAESVVLEVLCRQGWWHQVLLQRGEGMLK